MNDSLSKNVVKSYTCDAYCSNSCLSAFSFGKFVKTIASYFSLKSLGFSLDDIKNKLPSLDTPQDVAKILSNQAVDIKNKIQSLEKTLSSIEQLKTEVLQMQF